MEIREYLDNAIKNGKSVTIKYIKYKGEFSIREISDIQYSEEFGDDYIQAFCHKRQEMRTFKISRILSVDDISNTPSNTSNVTRTKSAFTGNNPSSHISTAKPSDTPTNTTYKPNTISSSTYKPSTYSKPSNAPTSSSRKSEGCYIATMAYGDYNHPQVLKLREFRDNVLLKSTLGHIFVKIYYFVSPKLVRLLRGHNRINQLIRRTLDNVINWLNI